MRLDRLVPLLALPLLAGVSLGQVRIAESPSTVYSTIQAAVNAAPIGATVLVQEGDYASFTISQSLSVVAMPGANVRIPNGNVRVQFLDESETALISGLAIGPPPLAATPTLEIVHCQGVVRVEDCELIGAEGENDEFSFGADAVYIDSSPKVVIGNSTLKGGDPHTFYGHPARGGRGLFSNSGAALFHSVVEGGDCGSTAYFDAGHGGVGMVLRSGLQFVSGCEVRGGSGGYASDWLPGYGGDGGDGLRSRKAHLHLQDSVTQGGPGGGSFAGTPGPDGTPLVTGWTPWLYSSTARRLVTETLQVAGGTATMTVHGEPGDRVYLAVSSHPGHELVPGLGMRMLPRSAVVSTTPNVVIGGTGSESFDLPVLATGRVYLQAFVQDASGQVHLSSPAHLVVLDPVTPDCNGNGVSDFVDLWTGATTDADLDLVPDHCQSPTTYFIDAGAAPGGDGSFASPFTDFASGLAVATDGTTLLVAGGLYSGPSNRDLDLAGREVTLIGLDGAASCILDCEGLGRAFLGVGDFASIRELTIVNGKATTGRGGAILAGAGARVLNCVLADCEASAGGAIFADGPITVIDCSFSGCQALDATDIGGGGLAVSASTASAESRVLRSTFVQCSSASQGGGAAFLGDADFALSHIGVIDCNAVEGGGFHFTPSANRSLLLQQCRVTQCNADLGAGVGIASAYDQLRVLSCTFAGNTATTEGGGFYIVTDPSPPSPPLSHLRNTILWDNQAPTGAQLSLREQGSLEVSHCDVQGGAPAVHLARGHLLHWGTGNLDADPLFQSLHLGLDIGSPCIDAGSNVLLPVDRHDVDGDGVLAEPLPIDSAWQPRQVDDPGSADTGQGSAPVVDIGAMEFQG